MSETRCKDAAWEIPVTQDGTVSWHAVQVAVLMDIRDELKRLNAAIYCPNFLAIPRTLREIKANTTKRRRKPR